MASPANPQSWNQYAYVLNNPATLVDPFGLFGTDPDPALCSTSAGYAVCPGTVINVTGGSEDNGFDPPYVYFGPNNNPSRSGGGGGGIVTSSILRSRLQCAVDWTDAHGPAGKLGKLLAGNVVAEVVDLALRATDPGADRSAVAATALGDGVADAVVDPAKAAALNRSGAAIISGIAKLQEAGQITTLGLATTIEQSAPQILALAGRDLAGPVEAAMMVYSVGQFAYAYFEECKRKQ